MNSKYFMCESISVDYAIMEKTDSLYVVPADLGWDDVGSWMALGRYLEQDTNGNIFKGVNRTYNAHNNIIFSTIKEVIILDADNLFVIETDKGIIVGNKESLSKVHELGD